MTEPKTARPAPRPRRRPGAAGAPPLVLVALDPGAVAPLYEQVYAGLRRAILDGRLAPGARLPSTRGLAAELGVARNTVIEAFARLRTEGYVAGDRGGGTRVCATLPDALLAVGRRGGRVMPNGVPNGSPGVRRAAAPTALPNATPHAAPPTAPAAPPRVADRGRAHASAGRVLARPGVGGPPVPFRLGAPAVDAFPARLWARLEARRWRRGAAVLHEGDPAGEPALRAAVAAYLTTARGARCAAEQVFVVSGTQQALDLAARVLLDPGDWAWVEEPGYPGARAAFAAAGARVAAVPVDAAGLDPAAGERLAPDARLAYVTPSHQFPLGTVMSAPRRLALLAWARRAGAWVVEDDYDSEFRYAGRPLPCLQGLDAERAGGPGAGRVLYVGTFNKTLFPGLRVGYLVVPPPLVDAFRAARTVADRHPPTLVQGVLAEFLAGGHFARHVRRVRRLYAERQAALLEAAAAELSGVLTLAPDPAGLHLVGRLMPGLTAARVAEAAARRGVEVFPLADYYAGDRGASCGEALLLSYAAFEPPALRRGVRALRRAADEVRAGAPATPPARETR